jgi:ketosteroid isomerase-like protein
MSDRIMETEQGYLEAFNGHDAAKAASYVAADIKFNVYGEEVSTGRGNFRTWAESVMSVWRDRKLAINRLFIKGNWAFVEYVAFGWMIRDVRGFKATQRPFGCYEVCVQQFNDEGLMESINLYFDEAGFNAQLRRKKDAPPVLSRPPTPEIHLAKSDPIEDRLADWGRTVSDAWNTHDARAIAATSTPEVDITFAAMGGKTLTGKDLSQFFAEFIKANPRTQFTVTSAMGVDGYAIEERTVSTPKGKGAVMTHEWLVLSPAADGKLRRAWIFGNSAEGYAGGP